MEGSSSRGLVLMIIVVIVTLVVALIGIGSMIYNLLNYNTPFYSGSSNVAAASDTTASAVVIIAPVSTPTNKQFNYNFRVGAPHQFNAAKVSKSAQEANDIEPKTHKTNGASKLIPPKQGVRDEIITNEVRKYSRKVKANPSNIIRIEIPAAGINSPVIQSSDGDEALDNGMWLYPTSYDKGEKVLLCHRRYFGTNDSRSCWYIDRAKPGDIIKLKGKYGKVYKYRIQAQVVRNGKDLSILRASNDDIVKIITCTPLGKSTHRLVTIARRV